MLKSLAMSNYMSLLRLFFVSVLLISYSPSSYAERWFYKNRIYPEGEHIICDREGTKELLAMRISQWEENNEFEPRNPIPKEDCIRLETNVVFFEISEEYFFPYQLFLEMKNNKYGQYPCPWDPEERCITFYGPVVQYAKAKYLDPDGNWYKDVFVEIAGDILFVDHPDDIQEEGSNLGDMYANGEDVPEDDVEAARWRLATEQRDAEAQHSLGWMYDNGLGVPEDDVEAVRWYRMAAEQGYAKSQFNLGIMYAAGEGVPEDDVQAYVWLSLAAAQGIEPAEEMKQTISATMTGEAIASAQELSEKYRDAYGPVRVLE